MMRLVMLKEENSILKGVRYRGWCIGLCLKKRALSVEDVRYTGWCNGLCLKKRTVSVEGIRYTEWCNGLCLKKRTVSVEGVRYTGWCNGLCLKKRICWRCKMYRVMHLVMLKEENVVNKSRYLLLLNVWRIRPAETGNLSLNVIL